MMRPPKTVEAIAAFFIPSACREEVLGDLHERFTSPLRYCVDVLRTVPHVIMSRIRRTADPQLLLWHAFVLYLCFWGAAWYLDPALQHDSWGLLRLAIPSALVLLGMLLDDAYAKRGQRSQLQLIRGPLLGIAFAFLSQAVLWAAGSSLTLSLRIVLWAGALGLVLTLALRLAFSPRSTSPPGSI
jgi:hypothetical protein